MGRPRPYAGFPKLAGAHLGLLEPVALVCVGIRSFLVISMLGVLAMSLIWAKVTGAQEDILQTCISKVSLAQEGVPPSIESTLSSCAECGRPQKLDFLEPFSELSHL
jgi:hypothetical protein